MLLQGNRLTVLPPQLGQLDFLSSRSVLKLDNDPWVPPIEDQLVLGVAHVVEYIRTETYRYLYGRHIQVSFAKVFLKRKLLKTFPNALCQYSAWFVEAGFSDAMVENRRHPAGGKLDARGHTIESEKLQDIGVGSVFM